MFSWNDIERPILALAPMAGYTDSPYRRLVKEICPRVICFTEFTSVDGILHGNSATLRQLFFDAACERPIVAQIFGRKPENFAKAVRILTSLGVDAVDLNMGCPAKKIVSSDCGASLLKNPSLAEEIMYAAASNTPLPVSAKMRIGILHYDPEKFFDFVLRIVRSGAKMLTIHGRTSKQMYGGNADWQPIYEAKKIVDVPVIGNGDIKSGSDALERLGNLDGLMIGRGSFGNPWIFREIAEAFEKRTFKTPTIQEKMPWIERHLKLNCEFKGEKWGLIEMRKHFAWYVRGLPNASMLRQKLVTVSTKDEALAVIASTHERSECALQKKAKQSTLNPQ